MSAPRLRCSHASGHRASRRLRVAVAADTASECTNRSYAGRVPNGVRADGAATMAAAASSVGKRSGRQSSRSRSANRSDGDARGRCATEQSGGRLRTVPDHDQRRAQSCTHRNTRSALSAQRNRAQTNKEEKTKKCFPAEISWLSDLPSRSSSSWRPHLMQFSEFEHGSARCSG